MDALSRLTRLCRAEGFSPPLPVSPEGRLDGFDWPALRCGLYLWLSQTGEVYAGQSVDCRRRLREHQRANGDLTLAAFRPVPRAALTPEETRLILRAEGAFPTRNIKCARKTISRRPYDIAVATPVPEPRPMPDQSRRMQARFDRAAARPGFALLAGTARAFVTAAIPNPWATEGEFWFATLAEPDFLRITCGQQEVMTVDSRAPPGRCIRLLCPEALDLWPWPRLYETHSREHRWTRPRFDRQQDWSKMRGFCISLMRQTSAMSRASHCPQLFRPA